MLNNFKILALGLAVCFSVPSAHASKGLEDNDPLFPKELVGEMQIRSGLELVRQNIDQAFSAEQRVVVCDTSLESIYSGDALPKDIDLPADYQENRDYRTYGSKNLSLLLGDGGSKLAVKLKADSESVILLPSKYFNAKEECQAYKIINAFGLISQQNPELVTVQFDNEQIRNILSVANFESLAKGTHRRTWDPKNAIGFGNICIFSGIENFNSFDYNIKLIAPLVRDLALWKFIHGVEMDVLNLILKRTNNNTQTICRLFLYDTGPISESIVKQTIHAFLEAIDKHPSEVGQICMSKLGELYQEICCSMLPQETLELWGVQYRRDFMVKTNEQEVAIMWEKLKPFALKLVNEEFIRLAGLFKEFVK